MHIDPLTGGATIFLALMTAFLAWYTLRMVQESAYARRQSVRPICYLRVRSGERAMPSAVEGPPWLDPSLSDTTQVYVRIKNVGSGAALFPTLILVSKSNQTKSGRIPRSAICVWRDDARSPQKWGGWNRKIELEPLAPGEELRYWALVRYPQGGNKKEYVIKLFYADATGTEGSAQAWLARRGDAGHAYSIPGENARSKPLDLSFPNYEEADNADDGR